MPGKFLIDATDPRFLITANAGVMEFVRRVNPFAHTDVGSVLLELRDVIAGAQAYSPSYKDCAYVVLHTEESRIFAIAYGQRGLALRLSPSDRAAALADGGEPAPDVGPDWVSFPPYDAYGQSGAKERLRRWCERGFANATHD
jgi:hypothetical protein